MQREVAGKRLRLFGVQPAFGRWFSEEEDQPNGRKVVVLERQPWFGGGVITKELTLPGFAGMILTLGVAADANIVIFERVKEEYRAGKSVRAAIAAGYGKGFATIVDANVVTAITALILFSVATGGVRQRVSRRR